MSYTPTKGSPRPTVPGANIFEVAFLAAENLIAKIPASAALETEIGVVEASISAAMQEIDPNGQKASQRTAILNAAFEDTQSSDPTIKARGVATATTFAQDEPPHPTPWVRDARWICVNADAPDPLPGGP